jgi:integrase/recombinase XerC
MTPTTIADSIEAYLASVTLARSANTARTYQTAMRIFTECLSENGLDPDTASVGLASDDLLATFIHALKGYSPATERLYLTAVMGWYEYLAAERLADVNLPRLRLLIKRRARRPGIRLPQFPRREIERVLEAANQLVAAPARDERQRLRALRDRAFLLTLADTGLRVHEACNLRRGDLDIHEGRAVLVGKGDRQAVVRFSHRSLNALKDYMSTRAALDGASGRPLASLPVFARHDLGAGKKVLPMTTTTGRAIVHQRVRQALGADVRQAITPHTFRHYFVTTVLRGSGGNLKLAQELARHRNIAVTQRYAHLSDDELDRGYYEIFDA